MAASVRATAAMEGEEGTSVSKGEPERWVREKNLDVYSGCKIRASFFPYCKKTLYFIKF
jgi:hypothetical protein